MRFVNAGFFPRYVVARPAWLDDPRIPHVRSVSGCISGGPEGWIEAWRHNALGLYGTPELAREIGDGEAEIHGYRVWEGAYDEGAEVQGVDAEGADIPEGWVRFGFDAVSRGPHFFECSPLTCNNRAKDYAVNEHGLLTTAEVARGAARSFSLGGAEPGRYFVVEVWGGVR